MTQVDPQQQLAQQQQLAVLQQQLDAVVAENQQLRGQLESIQRRQEVVGKVAWGGARMLVPLLDRHKVVRTFGNFVETIGGFAGAKESWPAREKVIDDARVFAESCVRFAVRRRTLILVFTLLATAIPAIQIWLVVQQNEIIENQNEFFEIQVYDIVSRSMTEGDRNARLMTGALLSRSDPAFMRDVIEESFHPDLGGTYRADGVDAQELRLKDAAFRGHLVRAVVRGVEHRAGTVDDDELLEQSQAMLRRILADAGSRVPLIMRIGQRGERADTLEDEIEEYEALAEQVDGYLVQIGEAMRIYARLARATGEQEVFFADVKGYLRRAADLKPAGNRFAEGYKYGLEALLFDLAAEPELTDPAVDLSAAGLDVQTAHAKGLQALRDGIGDTIAWNSLQAQLSDL